MIHTLGLKPALLDRLEGSRKYLFGSVGVLGESNNSLVSGVFICRGNDIKPVVEVAPDYESYNYKAINFEDKADKEFFEAALAWDLEIDGKKWADGKAVSCSLPLCIALTDAALSLLVQVDCCKLWIMVVCLVRLEGTVALE